jgi:hypothetical protein
MEVCHVKFFSNYQVFSVAAAGHFDLNLFEKQHGGGTDSAFPAA